MDVVDYVKKDPLDVVDYVNKNVEYKTEAFNQTIIMLKCKENVVENLG